MATETWVLNETLEGLTDAGKTYNVNFVSNGTEYTQLRMDPDHTLEAELLYNTTTVYYYSWKNTAYRTITFSQPVTDPTLLAWLQSNGTKQGGGCNYD